MDIDRKNININIGSDFSKVISIYKSVLVFSFGHLFLSILGKSKRFLNFFC